MRTYLATILIISTFLATTGQPYQGNGNQGSGSSPIIIPIGSTRHHPIQYIDYSLDESENRQPRTFNVEGGHIPLNIIFNPHLDHLRVADSNDQSFIDGQNQRFTHRQEEPVYMYHEVNTPVFEEVLQNIGQSDNDRQQFDYNNNYYQENWQTNGQDMY